MSTVTLKDDIRSRVEKRMRELEPLVQEYEELRRILAVIDGEVAPEAGPARSAPRRALRRAGPARRRHSARTEQAQQLIAAQPGISVGELAQTMGIGTTYLYRLLPRLEREGKLRKERQGYHPA